MSKTEPIMFHTSEAIKNWLRERAKENQRSMTGELNHILQQAMEGKSIPANDNGGANG